MLRDGGKRISHSSLNGMRFIYLVIKHKLGALHVRYMLLLSALLDCSVGMSVSGRFCNFLASWSIACLVCAPGMLQDCWHSKRFTLEASCSLSAHVCSQARAVNVKSCNSHGGESGKVECG
jgi:hypothetical protein